MKNSVGTLVRSTGIIALIMGLGLASESDAAFTLQTSVSGVSYSGGGLSSSTLTSGQVINIGGSSVTVGAAGGTSYTNSLGTTLFLLNDFRTATAQSVPNEQIFVTNTTAGATDTGTFTFTMNILVSNLTHSGTGTFVEGPNTVAINLSNGDANYLVTGGPVAPPTLIIGGDTFTSSLPQAVSGNINSINNGGVSAVIRTSASAVPEPASVAMLGLGIVGVGGFMARRRLASR